MSERTLSSVYTSIYISLLEDLALEDPSLQDVLSDITLGDILTRPPNFSATELGLPDGATIPYDHSSLPKNGHDPFQEPELLAFGTPVRHHLESSTRQRLLEDIRGTLRSLALFLHGDTCHTNETKSLLIQLPDDIQQHKSEIQVARREIQNASHRMADLIVQIAQVRERFDLELKQAINTTLSTYDAARSASIDLLGATVEASLIKLSLLQARTERAFYNHHSKDGGGRNKTVAEAVEAAYAALRTEEKELKGEVDSLDVQLQEYETLLRLVDGGNGGYQQIVNDWTRVKQDTDECLKDLRRLGWTGD